MKILLLYFRSKIFNKLKQLRRILKMSTTNLQKNVTELLQQLPRKLPDKNIYTGPFVASMFVVVCLVWMCIRHFYSRNVDERFFGTAYCCPQTFYDALKTLCCISRQNKRSVTDNKRPVGFIK